MKRSLALLVLGLSLAPLAIFSTSAQNGAPVPPATEPRPVPPPPVPVPQATAQPNFGQPGMPGRNQVADVLSQNYSVKLEAKGGASSQTATLITAASQVNFSSRLGEGEAPTTVQLSGSIQEGPESQLILRYQLSASIPIVRQETVIVPKAPQAPGGRMARSIEYSNESATGAIHVTLGKALSLFTAGDRSYIVTISLADAAPEAKPEGKQAR